MHRVRFVLFSLLMLTSISLAGCFLPQQGEDVAPTIESKPFCGVRDADAEIPIDDWLCRALPAFNMPSNYGTMLGMECENGVSEVSENRHCSLTNLTTGELISHDWIAYFSTPWCTHCETTFHAYDNAIPADMLIVFNKDPGDEFSNMSEWKSTAEQRMNRTIDRPFLNGPEFAAGLDVLGIPMAFYVDSHGIIVDYTLGAQNNTQALVEKYQDLVDRDSAHLH